MSTLVGQLPSRSRRQAQRLGAMVERALSPSKAASVCLDEAQLLLGDDSEPRDLDASEEWVREAQRIDRRLETHERVNAILTLVHYFRQAKCRRIGVMP